MVMCYVGLCVVSLLLVAITQWIYRWKKPKWSGRGNLPPGSMGLPVIGETIELIIPNHSLDLSPFITKRLNRYGAVFKTNVMGRPIILSADAEVNHYILRQDYKLVEPWYMDLFAKVFKQAHNRPHDENIHKYMRNLSITHYGSDSIKHTLLRLVQQTLTKTLHNWANTTSINVKQAVSAMLIELGANYMFNYDIQKSSLNLVDSYSIFTKSLMSFPLNIPGTSYRRCLQEYEKIKSTMMGVVKERQASGETKGDMLDSLLKSMEVENFVTDEFVAQMLFALIFVSFDSISTTITLALKLLDDNPTVLRDLIAEHETIVKGRENPDLPLTWEEYKSMTFTLYVVNETLRIGSFVPGIMRRAKDNIEVNGYTIPKGWGIIFLSAALQLNPNTYEDPMTFNPWRWKKLSTSVTAKNYMPFGWGTRQCAGADYSRMLATIFLHTMVTKYRWKKIKGGEAVRTPILHFHNDLNIKVSKI